MENRPPPLYSALVGLLIKPTLKEAFLSRLPHLRSKEDLHFTETPSNHMIADYTAARDWPKPAESAEDMYNYLMAVKMLADNHLNFMAASTAEHRLQFRMQRIDHDEEIPRMSVRLEQRNQEWWKNLYQDWYKYVDALEEVVLLLYNKNITAAIQWLCNNYPQAFWASVWKMLLFDTHLPLYVNTDEQELLSFISDLIISGHVSTCRDALPAFLQSLFDTNQEHLLIQEGVSRALEAADITLGPRRLKMGVPHKGPFQILRRGSQ